MDTEMVTESPFMALRAGTTGTLGGTLRRVVAAALALALCVATNAGSADLYVFELADVVDGQCSSNFLTCSLREAVLEANLDPGHDTIYLPMGTMALSIAGLDDEALIGDLDILEDVTIIGQGAEVSILDGTSLGDRVLHIVDAGAAVTLDGLTITGGSISNGGGVFNQGIMAVNDCLIRGNTASQAGGGIWSEGDLSLMGCTVRSNVAESGSGGGIAVEDGTMTLVDSTVVGNTAALSGGGIRVSGSQTTSVVIETSAITENHTEAGGGGVVTNFSGTIDITNSTISGNSAVGPGGAIYIIDGTADLTHVTLANNTASLGTAIVGNPVIILDSCVIGGDCSANITSEGSNVSSPGTGCDLVLPSDRPGEPDLGLRPLAGYGGPTETHALLQTSPARSLAIGCPAIDQRGAVRVAPMQLFCDSGAFEYGAVAPGDWIFSDRFTEPTTEAWSATLP